MQIGRHECIEVKGLIGEFLIKEDNVNSQIEMSYNLEWLENDNLTFKIQSEKLEKFKEQLKREISYHKL